MFLKSMELFGFKSFADKTLVEFEPGITAIVGSNGCGKSNIVDAIKWVSGEKQAKNLRGAQMADVIFSGTDIRKSLSLAEVTVTIDNTSRVLDFDADSVTVGRRVFRDGESEYLINKSPVRLKDIEKLFMDTGIGKSSYSVMEQGQMDMILSKRAEDRRYIFEEAAGISKYKLQKKDSLRKLEDTRENLNRINDMIKELERQKEVKSKQAEKTKEYNELKGRFKELDVKMHVLRFKETDKKLTKIKDDMERLTSEREKISAKVASISTENEADENRLNEIRSRMWELERRLGEYKIRAEELDKKSQKNRQAVSEQQEYMAGVEKKLAAGMEKSRALAEERLKTEKDAAESKAKIASDREARQRCFDSRKNKIESIGRARDGIEKNQRLIREEEASQDRLREELEVVIRQLIQAIDKRKAELQTSESERQQVRDELHDLLKTADEALVSAKASLKAGRQEEASEALEKIDMERIKNRADRFESFEDGFRSILFDKTGIHAKKEELDRSVLKHTEAVADLRNANLELDSQIRREQEELDGVNDMIGRIEKDLSKHESDTEWMEKKLKDLDFQIKDADMQTENHKANMERSAKTIKELEADIEEGKGRIAEYGEKSGALTKEQVELAKRQKGLIENILSRKNVSTKDTEALARLMERISALDKSTVEHEYIKNGIEEYLWTEYEIKEADIGGIEADESMFGGLNEKAQALKQELAVLQQQVNPMAIDEFNEISKRFDYYIGQRNDIEKAREDILAVIEDINKTSVELFLSTFEEIQKNFSQIFRQLFEGGDASVLLLNPEDVLDSGIDINVRPPGKRPKSISELSGGEKALTAIALMFATYMVRPSPFCFLDEVDSPLDEQNIGRFIRMLKEFSKNTQFVIITHKKTTMRNCESMYGVTMEERGVSKVISMKMSGIATAD